ncbi:hypothetical protein ACJX0J_007048, partial [Zea mays]
KVIFLELRLLIPATEEVFPKSEHKFYYGLPTFCEVFKKYIIDIRELPILSMKKVSKFLIQPHEIIGNRLEPKYVRLGDKIACQLVTFIIIMERGLLIMFKIVGFLPSMGVRIIMTPNLDALSTHLFRIKRSIVFSKCHVSDHSTKQTLSLSLIKYTKILIYI